MRLATKLTLLLCGLSMALLGSVLFPLYVSERARALEQLQFRQVAEVQKFARVCADALSSGEEGPALGYLKTLMLFSEAGTIGYAALVGPAGEVRLHSDFIHGDASLRGRTLPGLPTSWALEASEGTRRPITTPAGPLELLSAPLFEASPFSPPRRAGTALIGYDRGSMDAQLGRLRSGLVKDVARLAAPALCVGVVLALFFGATLTRPISELEAAARRLGEGRLDSRLPADRRDELGRLAREFNAMAQKLGELDRLKDGFLAQITHDLGNPISAIASWVDLLLNESLGPVTGKQAEGLKVVLENAEYLNSLIGDILALTRLEAGRQELRPAPQYLRAQADAVLALLGPKAREYGVALECSVPEGARVMADPQALKRVLLNLVSNAMKFTPSGGRVSVSLCPRPGWDQVEVADTGVGIPEDRVRSLFQKFFQVPETKNKVRDARGTGLGLVICKQLVEAQGGEVGVRSEYGKGSTFYFALPELTRSSGSPSPERSETDPPGAPAAFA